MAQNNVKGVLRDDPRHRNSIFFQTGLFHPKYVICGFENVTPVTVKARSGLGFGPTCQKNWV